MDGIVIMIISRYNVLLLVESEEDGCPVVIVSGLLSTVFKDPHDADVFG